MTWLAFSGTRLPPAMGSQGPIRPPGPVRRIHGQSLFEIGEAAISDDGRTDWFVYILRCKNDTLYTGVTTDVQRRVREHEDKGKRCARYTSAFAPVELVYSCRVGAKSLAYRIEYRIKRLPREKKILLVSENFSMKKLVELLKIDE